MAYEELNFDDLNGGDLEAVENAAKAKNLSMRGFVATAIFQTIFDNQETIPNYEAVAIEDDFEDFILSYEDKRPKTKAEWKDFIEALRYYKQFLNTSVVVPVFKGDKD